MKKTIDRLTYNTETATEVASITYGSGMRDFRYYSEGLYQTDKGRWFLAGEGGAMTRYAVPIGDNSWSGGESISTLTAEEALDWCEKHDKSGVITQYFSHLVKEA